MTQDQINTSLKILIEQQSSLLNDLTKLLSTSDDAFAQVETLATQIDSIKNFDLSDNVDTAIQTLDSFSQIMSQIASLLDKHLTLFSVIRKGGIVATSNLIDITILDRKLLPVTLDMSYDEETGMLSIDSDKLDGNVYYLKATQNLDNTRIYSDVTFYVSSVELMNNSSKLYIELSVDIIQGIVINGLLNDCIIVADGIKYHIAKYGGFIENDKKYLVLYVVPSIKLVSNVQGSIITIHRNIFDDQIIELNLTDHDLNDVSSFYFNDAMRNLDTGEMVIYGKNSLPKFTFSYILEDNKEKRKLNG